MSWRRCGITTFVITFLVTTVLAVLFSLGTAAAVPLGHSYDGPIATMTGGPSARRASVGAYDRSAPSSGSTTVPARRSRAAEEPLAAEAFHYTSSRFVQAIAQEGLRPGSYATAEGDLSPLQAQIDLALPPNRGLLGGLVRGDLAGLRAAGYDVPEFTRVGRSFNMPGGGTEIQFPYAVPPRFLQVVRP